MLKRPWLLVAAALGIAAIGIALGVGFATRPQCQDILKELSNGDTPNQASDSHYSNTVTCERDCQVSFLRSEQPEHVTDANSKDSNSYCDTTDEFDLLAQESMAHWTFYIAILTGVGVALLIGTLLVTQITNIEFADASYRELRAYVVLKDIYGRISSDGKTIEIEIIFTNSGQTPARFLGYGLTYKMHPSRDSGVGFGSPQVMEMGPGGEHTRKHTHPLGGPGMDVPTLIVRYRYQDHAGITHPRNWEFRAALCEAKDDVLLFSPVGEVPDDDSYMRM